MNQRLFCLQLLAFHDSVTPFSPMLPALVARRHGMPPDAEVLFIAPAHFSRIFAAIESDYKALALRSREASSSSSSSSESHDDSLLELKRASSVSKNTGFQMVGLVPLP